MKDKVVSVDMNFYKCGLVLEWVIKGCGFGNFSFWKDDEGNLRIDDETMNKETVMAVFEFILDEAYKNENK